MQNTMVRGGDSHFEKKCKLGLGKKIKKEENYIKKGGKGLKNASYWAIDSKKRMHNIYP